MEIRENIPLAPYTTLGVGGPADRLGIRGAQLQLLGETINALEIREIFVVVRGPRVWNPDWCAISDRAFFDGADRRIGLFPAQTGEQSKPITMPRA